MASRPGIKKSSWTKDTGLKKIAAESMNQDARWVSGFWEGNGPCHHLGRQKIFPKAFSTQYETENSVHV